MEGNEESKNLNKESAPEQSGRTSFASMVRAKEEDSEGKRKVAELKSKRDDDLVFVVVSPILIALAVVFLFLARNKIEGVINPLTFAFFISMICFALGAFSLFFGGIRLFLHQRALKGMKKRP